MALDARFSFIFSGDFGSVLSFKPMNDDRSILLIKKKRLKNKIPFSSSSNL